MRFRVALSFPGERRGFVEEVAACLSAHFGKSRVLYDMYFEAEFARPNLDVYLQNLYRNESELIAVFLCKEYTEKDWCGLEWRALKDLIKVRKGDQLMLFRFDDAEVSGIFGTDGYISIRNRSPAQIASLILQRLGVQPKANSSIAELLRSLSARIDAVPDAVVKAFAISNDSERNNAVKSSMNELAFDFWPVFSYLERHWPADGVELVKRRLSLVEDMAINCAQHDIPEYEGGRIQASAGSPPSVGARLTAELVVVSRLFSMSLREWAKDVERAEASPTKSLNSEHSTAIADHSLHLDFDESRDVINHPGGGVEICVVLRNTGKQRAKRVHVKIESLIPLSNINLAKPYSNQFTAHELTLNRVRQGLSMPPSDIAVVRVMSASRDDAWMYIEGYDEHGEVKAFKTPKADYELRIIAVSHDGGSGHCKLRITIGEDGWFTVQSV